MDGVKVRVAAKSRIIKYAEGANPDTDEPIEIVEKDEVLEGAAALEMLKKLGIKEGDTTNATT